MGILKRAFFSNEVTLLLTTSLCLGWDSNPHGHY
jgi:hypothetical protein